ncbi:MAG: hypothetical protein AAGM67_20965, partial [Bacteroidota bacterium]
MSVLIFDNQTKADEALDKIKTFLDLLPNGPDVAQWPAVENVGANYYVKAPDTDFDSSSMDFVGSQAQLPSEMLQEQISQALEDAQSAGLEIIQAYLFDAFANGV